MWRPLLIASLWCLAVLGTGGCGHGNRFATIVDHDGPLTADLIDENNRGVGLMGRFEFERAHDIFAALVEKRPNWFDAKINLAVATFNRRHPHDLDTARALLAEVLKIDKKSLRAHYCLGLAQLQDHLPEQALPQFQFAAGGDPRDAYAAYYAGQCLLEMGCYEAALPWFEQAIRRDPYLRSAYYGCFQTLQWLQRGEQAAKILQDLQQLATNPQARTAEFRYSKMGPHGVAITVDLPKSAPLPLPEGPVFANALPLVDHLPDDIDWSVANRSNLLACSLSACDIDGDRQVDLFLAGGVHHASDKPQSLVLLAQKEGFRADFQHPLATVTYVRAALWGDYDNDGLTDVFLCREGASQLWQQTDHGKWHDVTVKTNLLNPRHVVDGAFVDLDHDGDLDLFLVYDQGLNALWTNDRGERFRDIATEKGIAGQGRPARGLLVVDLDADCDADLIVIKRKPPHRVFVNDRLMAYRWANGFADFVQAEILAVVAADANADGQMELYTLLPQGLWFWTPDAKGHWHSKPIMERALDASAEAKLAVADIDGDARPEAIFSDGKKVCAVRLTEGFPLVCELDAPGLEGWALASFDPAAGPALVGFSPGHGPLIWQAGQGRWPFVALELTGRHETRPLLRSNTSGIGAKLSGRIDSRWTVTNTWRNDSGPGQSLQPAILGLGGARSMDFVRIDWPDGVLQTELSLTSDKPLRIAETQR